jgi:hypothetical protein
MMAAAAHNPAFAKKVGIPQSVAQDINALDAGTGILKGPLRRKKRSKAGDDASSPMIAFTQPGNGG